MYLKAIFIILIFLRETAYFGQVYGSDGKLHDINGGGQQSVYYQKAATTARKAAEKTKCPDRIPYLIRIAEWNECMVDLLAGRKSSCGELNLGTVPPCDGDMIGGGNANMNAATSGQSILAKQQELSRQTEIELDNAKNASLSAYQSAISNGRKESGAILDATLSGAQEISDPTSSLIYTGIGLGIALFTSMSEHKEMQMAKDREMEKIRNEEKRRKLTIEAKENFIVEALSINKYNFSDLVSKKRYATVLCIPNTFNSKEQNIAFTYPIEVPEYSDGTHPLKPEIEKELLLAIDKNFLLDKIIYILYPIVDLDNFSNDFVKKMGSGKVISLNAELINYFKTPFEKKYNMDSEEDFWGNTMKNDSIIKQEKRVNKPTPKKQDNFWDN